MVDNFTDLALLIGTNPLPNYVIAKYFLKRNPDLKKIWLIHSEKGNGQEGTLEFAENIRAVIMQEFNQKKLNYEFVSLSNVGSALVIKKDLENKFFSKLNGNEKIHLNYTGGTKSMAVHVYRNLEQRNNCSFSYLDARSHRLKSDDFRDAISNDLRNDVNITLNDLIKLHGYEKYKEESSFKPHNLNDILNVFEDWIEHDKISAFLTWKNEIIRKIYYDKKDFIINVNKFLKHNDLSNEQNNIDVEKIEDLKNDFDKKTTDELKNLLRMFSKENSILDEYGKMWIPDRSISNRIFKKRLEAPIKNFLDGKWLESYVNNILHSELTNDSELSEKYRSHHITIDSNWKILKHENIKDFELDVIVLNGYQVCGISCTTSNEEGLCKEKAFEVLHRVKQIGGEEAKAVLISCLEDEKKDAFVNDIRNISGSSEADFITLTISDLKAKTLWKNIKEHIWGGE